MRAEVTCEGQHKGDNHKGEGHLAEQGGKGVQGVLRPSLGLQGLGQHHLAPLGMTTAHMHSIPHYLITLACYKLLCSSLAVST